MSSSVTDSAFEASIAEHVTLAPFTTLGIGGPARYFAEATSTTDLLNGIEWARQRDLPLFVLGGGSNVVVSDEGFRGLVLRVQLRGIETRADGDRVIVEARAGEDWDSLVSFCVNKGLAGIECLSGIPGLVGATPVQNVGAYGQEISETVVSVEAVDLTTKNLVAISGEACGFAYRSSRFKAADRGRFVVTKVSYRLAPNGRASVRYPELKACLKNNGRENTDAASIKEVRAAVLAIRKRKAMVIDPSDPDSRSVGSFFVNPVTTRETLERVRSVDTTLPGIPNFPAGEEMVKLSAAWLIEQAGMRRGYVRGGVGISKKHTLAIINLGTGTAREVLALAEEMKSRVRDKFGIELVPEPVFVGF
ncbi:MAG: UDP-N-acetylenolpyruvoylglucosamine reductase [Blastocatellia bacterium AA13]|nr:MAG: UDP-N-acetylenolpyruvoylglucosamine reductase [Blastocatellia bacterium AA13]